MKGTLLAVVCREWHRMTSRRIYFAACIVLPLFSLLFMATIFGNGRMENLPIGIVDADNSSASRNIIRMVEATPALQIVKRYANETEALSDVQQKNIYGYLFIPSNYAEKVGNNEAVTLVYYYHNAMLSVGGELRATFEQLLKQVSVTPIVTEAVALGESETIATSFLIPITETDFPIYNQNRNYTIYLSQPFYFIFIQILLLLVTTYALGNESKFGTSDEWLQAAKGNIAIAVAGKLLPYTFIYIAVSILANFVFFGWMNIPLPCCLWSINIISILFILATQALALALYSLLPVLSIIISVASMIGSLGATLSGVTFPLSFMDRPIYVISYLFPIRHFMEAVQMLLYNGGDFTNYWTTVVALLLFILLPLPLLARLSKALISHKYATFE